MQILFPQKDRACSLETDYNLGIFPRDSILENSAGRGGTNACDINQVL